MKVCTKCGASKSLSDFHRQPKTKDGLSYWCKECKNAFAREWRQTHEERYREGLRRYRDANVERLREFRRAQYAKNKQAHYESHRRWCKANAGRLRDIKQRRRAKIRGVEAEKIIDRSAILANYRGLCGICLQPVDPLDFHVDHIIPLAKGGNHTYANVQPAHPACNLKKGANVQSPNTMMPRHLPPPAQPAGGSVS